MLSEGGTVEKGYYWVEIDGCIEIAYHLGQGGWMLAGDEELYKINDFQEIGSRVKGQDAGKTTDRE